LKQTGLPGIFSCAKLKLPIQTKWQRWEKVVAKLKQTGQVKNDTANWLRKALDFSVTVTPVMLSLYEGAAHAIVEIG
jgi:hypothetical protein